MDKIVGDIAAAIPNLAALIFVVMTFLKHMAERDKKLEQLHSEGMLFVQNATKEYLTIVQETKEVIKENTLVMGKVLERIKIS